MVQPYSSATSPYTPDPVSFVPKIRLPFARQGNILLAGGLNYTKGRLTLATITTDTTLPSVEAGQSLFLAAACPTSYDGERVHEAGFNYYPEASYLSQSTGGQLTLLGVYSFIFVWEWLDAKGLLWRSAPSDPVSVTLTSSNNRATFKVSPLLLTDKQDTDTASNFHAVRLVCYHTTAGGAIYYREQPTGSDQDNINKVSDGADSDIYRTASSTYTDSALANGEIIYTAGDVLENEAFPSTTVCCTHQRRLWMVLQDDQNFLQFTSEMDDIFLAADTNEAYRILVPESGGSVVGIASMDDKLIIFCQSKIYYIFGEGPDRLGNQNGYSLPQICSSSMGAMGGAHNSIALTPEGLWFLSSTGGLRLLTRGLSIAANENGSYLGTEADGLVPTTITQIRSARIDAKNQVRWYLSDGTVVVWDYQQRQWSKFTNHTSTGGAVSARGLFWHSDGTLLQSSNAAAGGLDDATTATQVVETAWIAMSDIQGFQRVYKLLLLGQAMSACTVDVAVGYDYDETWIDSSLLQQGTGTPCIAMAYTGLSGVFTVNDVITGQTSNAAGTVVYAAAGVVVVSNVIGTFQVAEVIENDNASTATTTAVQSDILAVSGLSVAPSAEQPIVGATSGATAVISFVTSIGVSSYLLTLSGTVGSFGTETIRISKLFRYSVAAAANPLQLEHPMHKQQCEAVRFRVTITPGSSAEAVRLTNFGLTVGLKKGTHKFASSKRF